VQDDIRYELEGYHFIWNKVKANSNNAKHGITFEEAATVFLADQTVYGEDEAHSAEEERIIAIGMSSKMRILMVCHCLRESDNITRIISARKATREELLLWQR
jgi:uncharacterized DUF497 family protein